jgi:hypothetical protein
MTRKKVAPTSVIIRVSPAFAKLVKARASTASSRLGRRVSVVEYTHSIIDVTTWFKKPDDSHLPHEGDGP